MSRQTGMELSTKTVSCYSTLCGITGGKDQVSLSAGKWDLYDKIWLASKILLELLVWVKGHSQD